MKKFYKVLSVCMALVMSVSVLAGCSSNSSSSSTKETKNTETIKLATMTDDESQIFGEIMKQLLEAKGFKIDSTGVGTYNNTTLPRQSLQEGQIDITMDYTGRGMMFIDNVDTKNYTTDLKTAFNTTKEADAKNSISWIAYAPFNNTDTICVSKSWATEHNISDFNDLAKYINEGGEFKLAIDPDYSYYLTSETDIPGWEKTYGFKLSDSQVISGVTDPQSKVSAGTDGITACNCTGTSGLLDSLNLVNIKDPQIVSPIYSPAALIRTEVLEKYPELEEVLAPAFEKMTEEKMCEYNKRYATDGESASKIAKEYLQQEGLI